VIAVLWNGKNMGAPKPAAVSNSLNA